MKQDFLYPQDRNQISQLIVRGFKSIAECDIELIIAASVNKQIIVSTQSVQLLNQFEPENLIVVDRDKNQSTFRRLTSKECKTWLKDYTFSSWVKWLSEPFNPDLTKQPLKETQKV